MTETSLKERSLASGAAPFRRRGGDLTNSRHAGDLANACHAVARRLVWFAVPLTIAWRYRELVVAMLRRELADRFRGSLFGWAWAVVAPLITLAIYTVTFAGALRLPIASMRGGTINYA